MGTISDFELSLLLIESGQGADIGRKMRRIMLHFLPDMLTCRHPKHAGAKSKESLEDIEAYCLQHDRPPFLKPHRYNYNIGIEAGSNK
jgi:hypothetical protein